MNKEQYVTFEEAKLLKDKGFDWVVNTYYCDDYNYAQHDIIEYKKENYNSHKVHISAPTQAMACDWLREEHEIDIIPIIRHSLKYAQESPFRDYACRVYDCDGNIVLSATKWYSRYENAVEAALEYVLTKLI